MDNQPSFWKGLWSYVSGAVDTITPIPGQRLRLSGRGIRVPFHGYPFEVQMGEQLLDIYPDIPLRQRQRRDHHDFILFDPKRYFHGIGHALRLRPGEKLSISHRIWDQRHVFTHPREAFRRYLQVAHEGDSLIFWDSISELGTYLSLIADEQGVSRLSRRRQGALEHLRQDLGAAVTLLPPDEALDLLCRVNRLLVDDPYRPRDDEGNAGALLELPDHLIPVLLGDLHAQVDNLLTVLTENGYLEAMSAGRAVLVILGDAVHPEEPDEAEFMDSSLMLMDIIFHLKLRFPSQVFFVLGNHDSFDRDVMKHGVLQGAVWERRVMELRGRRYRDELARFYRQSPLVVKSAGFIACHAAPARRKLSRDSVVSAWHFPDLVRDLTRGRLKSLAFPAGYTRADVRRFRNSLKANRECAFIVGHYPRSENETVWLNVGKIPGHHVLYSARPDQVAVMTRFDGEMVPQIYPVEPMSELLSRERGRLPAPEAGPLPS
ncbi:MAG: metallophosphoesterase [Gammaproteobacteria bacterium]|nr:metallophosphoesterase [Gammaproteobacteria bacterium]